MRSAFKSDRGLVRENNEDYVIADEENSIFLLADGMGGGPAGEVASHLAATTAHVTLKKIFHDYVPMPEDLSWLLANVLTTAHLAVFKKTLAEPAFAGMGTTLDMVIIRDGKIFICHVGDSRVYLFQRKILHQITTDDNYAAVLAASGKTPPAQIPPDFRHILTQVVGISEKLVPEFHTFDPQPGDLILMCSDGLNEALSDEEIGDVIGRNRKSFAAIPAALVEAANEKGGPDNVSVVIIEPSPIVLRSKARKNSPDG